MNVNTRHRTGPVFLSVKSLSLAHLPVCAPLPQQFTVTASLEDFGTDADLALAKDEDDIRLLDGGQTVRDRHDRHAALARQALDGLLHQPLALRI